MRRVLLFKNRKSIVLVTKSICEALFQGVSAFLIGECVMINLYEDERLDYLLAENLRIIQSPSVFSFSLDAVLLARFAYLPIQKGILLTCAAGMVLFLFFLAQERKRRLLGLRSKRGYMIWQSEAFLIII